MHQRPGRQPRSPATSRARMSACACRRAHVGVRMSACACRRAHVGVPERARTRGVFPRARSRATPCDVRAAFGPRGVPDLECFADALPVHRRLFTATAWSARALCPWPVVSVSARKLEGLLRKPRPASAHASIPLPLGLRWCLGVVQRVAVRRCADAACRRWLCGKVGGGR